jgi:hypothetical protein
MLQLISFFKTEARAAAAASAAQAPAKALQGRLKREFATAEPSGADKQAPAERPLPMRVKPTARSAGADWSEF